MAFISVFVTQTLEACETAPLSSSVLLRITRGFTIAGSMLTVQSLPSNSQLKS